MRDAGCGMPRSDDIGADGVPRDTHLAILFLRYFDLLISFHHLFLMYQLPPSINSDIQ